MSYSNYSKEFFINLTLLTTFFIGLLLPIHTHALFTMPGTKETIFLIFFIKNAFFKILSVILYFFSVKKIKQNRVIANLIICIISCVMNAILHYGLVYQAKMGIKLVDFSLIY